MDFIEVARAESMEEAIRLVDVVLRGEGIEAQIHDRVDHALLAPASQPGGYFIAVQESDRERALAVLKEQGGDAISLRS